MLTCDGLNSAIQVLGVERIRHLTHSHHVGKHLALTTVHQKTLRGNAQETFSWKIFIMHTCCKL